MAYEVLPFIVLSIQINELIIQRSTCLHAQRSMLSKPNTPIVTFENHRFNCSGLLLNAGVKIVKMIGLKGFGFLKILDFACNLPEDLVCKYALDSLLFDLAGSVKPGA